MSETNPTNDLLAPHNVRRIWEGCRDMQPRTARIRAEIDAGIYDPDGAKEAVAGCRLADVVAKASFADAVAAGMDAEHGEDTRAERENFGATREEEENVGERWDGLS